MTLTHRLLRRLGYDVTKELELREDRYKYTVQHTNGEITTESANAHYHDGAFLILVDIPTVGEVSMGAGRLSPPFNYSSWDVVRRLEGIQEYEREVVGEDVWSAQWSLADGSLMNIECEKQ